MAKQRKLMTYPPVSNSFFDEMEEEMNKVNVKRKKINKEPPEKLFLQFAPNRREDISKNNNASQPLPAQRSQWKPPIKMCNELENSRSCSESVLEKTKTINNEGESSKTLEGAVNVFLPDDVNCATVITSTFRESTEDIDIDEVINISSSQESTSPTSPEDIAGDSDKNNWCKNEALSKSNDQIIFRDDNIKSKIIDIQHEENTEVFPDKEVYEASVNNINKRNNYGIQSEVISILSQNNQNYFSKETSLNQDSNFASDTMGSRSKEKAFEDLEMDTETDHRTTNYLTTNITAEEPAEAEIEMKHAETDAISDSQQSDELHAKQPEDTLNTQLFSKEVACAENSNNGFSEHIGEAHVKDNEEEDIDDEPLQMSESHDIDDIGGGCGKINTEIELKPIDVPITSQFNLKIESEMDGTFSFLRSPVENPYQYKDQIAITSDQAKLLSVSPKTSVLMEAATVLEQEGAILKNSCPSETCNISEIVKPQIELIANVNSENQTGYLGEVITPYKYNENDHNCDNDTSIIISSKISENNKFVNMNSISLTEITKNQTETNITRIHVDYGQQSEIGEMRINNVLEEEPLLNIDEGKEEDNNPAECYLQPTLGQTIESSKENANIMDEDYSCLMISNSQLEEIENNYFEASSAKHNEVPVASDNNNEQLKKLSDNNVISYESEFKENSKSNILNTNKQQIHVGSNTLTCMQNVALSVPRVQWPKNMLEMQKKMRELTGEINRLNALLMDFRREIWPQRHQNGSGEGKYP